MLVHLSIYCRSFAFVDIPTFHPFSNSVNYKRGYEKLIITVNITQVNAN